MNLRVFNPLATTIKVPIKYLGMREILRHYNIVWSESDYLHILYLMVRQTKI